jgi:hypothetical protein
VGLARETEFGFFHAFGEELVVDIYETLAADLIKHGILAARAYAKELAHAACYNMIMNAKQTFVVERWFNKQ